MKNAVFWYVAPCRSCVNRRFGGSIASIFRIFVSASHWSLSSAPSRNLRNMTPDLHGYADQCTLGSPALFPPTWSYIGSGLLPTRPSLQTLPLPSPPYWFPLWPTLLPFLSLYSWVFSTDSSVCSHLVTLVPRSRIFLPWRWRRYVPPKRRFTQDLHGATSQKTAFFKLFYVCQYS
jgi:hypothetical protein